MTVAKTDSFSAFQEILALDIDTCTTEVCIASRKDHEGMPEFRRLRLGEAVKEEFRNLVSTALIEYHKELHLCNLQLLDFSVASKPASYQVENMDLSKHHYDNILEQTRPLTML